MIIDLSHLVNEQTPVYPGDPKTKIELAGVLEKDGWCDHYISIGTHVGTHIDAPAHMLAGGKTLNQIPLEQFVGRGVCLTVDDQFDLESIKRAGIQPGDIVLFYTGADTRYHESNYFSDYPAMPEAVANYLAEQRVKMVGLDTCQPDAASDEAFPIHKLLLDNNILIIENLTNLDKLAGKRFKVYALPIKLEIDGAPARVIAEVEDE